ASRLTSISPLSLHERSSDLVIAAEPLQSTPRRAVVEKNVQNASAMMGWHTIPIQHPDLYALDVLAKVLGGGESSRLTRELREERSEEHTSELQSRENLVCRL